MAEEMRWKSFRDVLRTPVSRQRIIASQPLLSHTLGIQTRGVGPIVSLTDRCLVDELAW